MPEYIATFGITSRDEFPSNSKKLTEAVETYFCARGQARAEVAKIKKTCYPDPPTGMSKLCFGIAEVKIIVPEGSRYTFNDAQERIRHVAAYLNSDVSFVLTNFLESRPEGSPLNDDYSEVI